MARHRVFLWLGVLGLLLTLGGLVVGVRVLALGFFASAGPSATGNSAENFDANGNSDGIFQLQNGSDRFYHFAGGTFSPPIREGDLENASMVAVIYRTDRVGHSFALSSGTQFTQTPNIYEAVQITIYTSAQDTTGITHTSADYTQANARILITLALGVLLMAVMFPLWRASVPRQEVPSEPAVESQDPMEQATAKAQALRMKRAILSTRADALIRGGWTLVGAGIALYLAFALLIIPDLSGVLSSVALTAPLPGAVALIQGYRLRRQSLQ